MRWSLFQLGTEDRSGQLFREIRALAIDQRLKAGVSFGYVKVEGLRAVLDGVDQLGDVDTLRIWTLLLEPVEIDQQKRQRCEALLVIDDETLAVLLRHDDGVKKNYTYWATARRVW